MGIFYQPEGYRIADTMAFCKDGVFYLYHYKIRKDRKEDALSWTLTTTKDFISFEDRGESLLCGAVGEKDFVLRSGWVIEEDGTYHFLYGCNYATSGDIRKLDREILIHAVSKDLQNWEKDKDWCLIPPKGYALNEFRDPYVFWCDDLQQYALVVGARKIDPEKPDWYLNGATLLYVSSDLRSWEFCSELWAPEAYTMHEMPALFKIGSWWYLITSEYSRQIQTVYRMSRQLNGPWICPEEDGLDSKAYFAARTIRDDQSGKLYLIGWVAEKDGTDTDDYCGGGTLLVHEVTQNEDGTLHLSLPEEIRKQFRTSVKCEKCEIRAEGSREFLFIDKEANDDFLLSFDIIVEPKTEAIAVDFRQNPKTGETYQYKYSPRRQQLILEREPSQGIIPPSRWPDQMERLEMHIPATENNRHHVELIVSGEISTCYIDGIPLTVRTKERFGTGLSIAVYEGAASFENLKLERFESEV